KFLIDRAGNVEAMGSVSSTKFCLADVCQTSWGGSNLWAANGSNIYSTNSGNVGIGTNGPGNKLSVNGDIGAQNLILSAAPLATYPGGSQSPSYYFYQTTGTNDYWQIYGEGGSNNGALVFETGDDGSEPFIFRQKQTWSPYTRTRDSMILDGNGNLGIGTTAPGNALSISRNDALSTQQVVIYNPNTNWQAESLIKAYTDVNAVGTPAAAFGFYRGAATDAQSGFIVKTGTRDSLTTDFIINQSGNVGIGTIDPTNGKLEVQGAVGTAIYGENNGGPHPGVYGKSASEYGVQGEGQIAGVFGSGSQGVHGTGGTTGVYGESTSIGVQGLGDTKGMEGDSVQTGVEGGGVAIGVRGATESCIGSTCYLPTANSVGVLGESAYGIGVKANGTTYDFYGASGNPNYFSGSVSTGGTLTAGGVFLPAQISDSSAGTCDYAHRGAIYYSNTFNALCTCRGGQWCNLYDGQCGSATACHP
ncbi:MAG TPA: hypothetical protein VMD74_00355, partial [Candidatus Methylomirabilis sp.]|nr:hypothetical protein [Candidatus Methylomirabilis sp.]